MGSGVVASMSDINRNHPFLSSPLLYTISYILLLYLVDPLEGEELLRCLFRLVIIKEGRGIIEVDQVISTIEIEGL